jgi:hypothetical protein
MKVTDDGFVWKLIDKNKAKQILMLELFDLYALHNDGSESLILNFLDLDNALENGDCIGMEVGNLNK